MYANIKRKFGLLLKEN